MFHCKSSSTQAPRCSIISNQGRTWYINYTITITVRFMYMQVIFPCILHKFHGCATFSKDKYMYLKVMQTSYFSPHVEIIKRLRPPLQFHVLIEMLKCLCLLIKMPTLKWDELYHYCFGHHNMKRITSTVHCTNSEMNINKRVQVKISKSRCSSSFKTII